MQVIRSTAQSAYTYRSTLLTKHTLLNETYQVSVRLYMT